MLSENITGIIIASIVSPLILYIVQQIFLRRGNKADTLGKLEGIIDKVQERADKLYDDKVAGEVAAEKLRNDLATALVTIADLQKELANKDGYIQGITDPLLKIEAAQKAALEGGRRANDRVEQRR